MKINSDTLIFCKIYINIYYVPLSWTNRKLEIIIINNNNK